MHMALYEIVNRIEFQCFATKHVDEKLYCKLALLFMKNLKTYNSKLFELFYINSLQV